MSVSGNARRFAMVAHLDKVRLLFARTEQDLAQVHYNSIIAAVQDMTGWSDEITRKMVRYNAYYVKGERHGYSIQFVGKACKYVYSLPFVYALNATEVEVKGYVNCKDDSMGNYYWFLDAMGTQPGRYNRTTTVNGRHTSKNKSGAERSLKVGSNKSDKQSGIYARRGERPGIEVSVKRRLLRKCAEDVTAQMSGVDGDGTDRHKWAALVRKCAIIGYAQFEAELTRLGVQLKDYFDYFADAADYLGREDELVYDVLDNGATVRQEELGL